MDYNTPNGYPNPGGNTPDGYPAGPVREKGSGMATTALVLGILSIVTLCCIYPPFILGGLGITFALLSRGKREKMAPNAQTGMILSIIGSSIILVIIIAAFIFVFTNAEYRKMIMDDYQEYYYDYYDYYNFDGGDLPGTTEPVFPGNSGDL